MKGVFSIRVEGLLVPEWRGCGLGVYSGLIQGFGGLFRGHSGGLKIGWNLDGEDSGSGCNQGLFRVSSGFLQGLLRTGWPGCGLRVYLGVYSGFVRGLFSGDSHLDGQDSG